MECRRVNGNPRIVWQKYLGRAEEILRATRQASAPEAQEVRLRQFGAVAARLNVADQLNVDWYEQTVLGRLWRLPAWTFTSQRFWDAMDAISEEAIAAIERDLVENLVKTAQLDLRAILYDTTNFATFIDTLNDRNTIAQRGHARKKRHDLRLVGLALVVTKTFGIPLFHETYRGNINDTTQFGSLVLQLTERYRQLAATCQDLTLVFDKGNNSEDNFTLLGMEQVHFVARNVRWWLPSRSPFSANRPMA